MNRELLDFAAAHDGVFARKHALGFGLTRREIDSRLGSAWKSVHEGVYRIDGTPVTLRGRLLAAVWSAPALAAVSHRSAAFLYALPGGSDDVVEVLRIRGTTATPKAQHRRSKRPELRHHLVDFKAAACPLKCMGMRGRWIPVRIRRIGALGL